MKQTLFDKVFDYYFNNYKKLLILPIIVLLLLISSIIYTKATTGEYVQKDISLTGGVSVIINTNQEIDVTDLQNRFELNEVRFLREFTTQEITGIEILNQEQINTQEILDYLNSKGIIVTSEDLNVLFVSSVLANTFIKQATITLLISFLLMSLVIYFYFRNWLSAASIVLSTVSDVIGVIALMNILGIKLGIASIGAILMLIGYSSDSDVLLATKIIREKDQPLKVRMKQALKTELTMDFAAIAVFSTMAFVSNNSIIKEIGIVLLFGIFFDFFNTWIQNASVQRWFVYERGKKQ